MDPFAILKSAGGDALVLPLAFSFLVLMFYGDRKVRSVEKAADNHIREKEKVMYIELEKVRKGHLKDMDEVEKRAERYCDIQTKHHQELNQKDILSIQKEMAAGFKNVTDLMKSIKDDLDKITFQKVV